MRRFYKHKLQGNTIIEVLIALSIISFCASLAVVIYLNIQKSSLPFFKVKAVELAERYMKESIDQRKLDEAVIKNEEFSVKRFVEAHPQFPDCYVVRIIVFDGTLKKIHQLETVLYKTN